MTVKADVRTLLGALVATAVVACGGASSPEDPAGVPGVASLHSVGSITPADLNVYYSSVNPPVIDDTPSNAQWVAVRDRVVVRGGGFTSANAGDWVTISIFSGPQLLAQHAVGASDPRCNPLTGVCAGGGVFMTTFSPDELGSPYYSYPCPQPIFNAFPSGLRIVAHDDTVGYATEKTIEATAFLVCEIN